MKYCGHVTELRLTNFKAFGETQRIPIKPLTLIFGANSSGKSSIIHSLLLARHALDRGELDVFKTDIGGDSADLGGIRQYTHTRDGPLDAIRSSPTMSLLWLLRGQGG